MIYYCLASVLCRAVKIKSQTEKVLDKLGTFCKMK